jgi:O-antigen ligase
LEITQQWWAVFPKHIADPASGIHFGRARGPMVHAVSYGSYLGVCLLAVWAWQWRFDNKGRLVLMALLPLLAAGVFFSYTRSAWLGIALGMTIMLGLTLRGAWRPLVLGTIVSVGLLLAVTKMDKLVEFDRGENIAHARSSVALRGDMAYLSWNMFLDRPLFGAGFDQFRNAKLPYLADRSSEFKVGYLRNYSHHNTLLSLLTETGLVGLSLFLAVLGGWGWAAWKLARSTEMPDWARAQGALLLGALGVYIAQAAFHELSYTAIDNVLLFTLAGLTVGLHAELTGKTPAAENNAAA